MDITGIKKAIVHDNCADGLVSALLIQDAIPGIEIEFVQYKTPECENLKVEPGMIFLDFSPPESRAMEFVDAGARILDHHKTAELTVQKFGDNGVFGDEALNPGVCGATLTYHEIWSRVNNGYHGMKEFAFNLAALAGIRDTWQKHSPRWREACTQQEILTFVPRERWMSLGLEAMSLAWDSTYAWIGPMLMEKNDKSIAKAVKGARRYKTENGTRVVIFEGATKTSDAADVVTDADLIVGFAYFEEDAPEGRRTKMVVSTRTRGDYKCSELAKFYGGGGHTKAAGFSVNIVANEKNPYSMIQGLIYEYENRL